MIIEYFLIINVLLISIDAVKDISNRKLNPIISFINPLLKRFLIRIYFIQIIRISKTWVYLIFYFLLYLQYISSNSTPLCLYMALQLNGFLAHGHINKMKYGQLIKTYIICCQASWLHSYFLIFYLKDIEKGFPFLDF